MKDLVVCIHKKGEQMNFLDGWITALIRKEA